MKDGAGAGPDVGPSVDPPGGPGAGVAREILVIKLGALGDFVQATGPFRAIRDQHPGDRITLLTTPPFESLARAGGWFDDVLLDRRPRFWDIAGWYGLRRRLRRRRFGRVYDLQTADRSAIYFRLLNAGSGKGLEWSGIVRNCSHRHVNPRRRLMHTVERQADQLRVAGIAAVPAPSLDGIAADVSRFALTGRYVLLVPGGARHRPEKRWPAVRYAALAKRLVARGLTPVVLGAAAEHASAMTIAAANPLVRDLTGDTSFEEIITLARGAAGAVGNDTGPMHLIGVAGTPSVVLFSHASDPKLCAPRGPDVSIVRLRGLADLEVAEVEATMRLR